jgi:hypothetical protein
VEEKKKRTGIILSSIVEEEKDRHYSVVERRDRAEMPVRADP